MQYLNCCSISDAHVTVIFRMLWAIVVGGVMIIPAKPTNAAEPVHNPFFPGYRFYQVWLEDSRPIAVAGVDVYWAAIHPRGFEVDLGTGLRAITRHSDAYVAPAWTASVALTVPHTTAPYLELGFDLGEALARNLLDWGVEDPKLRGYIEPDTWLAVGMRATVNPNWAFKLYYKKHSIEGRTENDVEREVWGIAIVRRIPRKPLAWWQVPL